MMMMMLIFIHNSIHCGCVKLSKMWICSAHHREHALMRYTAFRTSALISVKLVLQPDTSSILQDNGYGLVYNAMYLFTSPAFAGYSFYLPTVG